MSFQLKIKTKYLTAEARAIRHEIKRNGESLSRISHRKAHHASVAEWAGRHITAIAVLSEHLDKVVTPIARATNLARACLAGTPANKVEPIAYTEPQWPLVERMVVEYGPWDKVVAKAHVAAWKAAHVVSKRKPRVKRSGPSPCTLAKRQIDSFYTAIQEALATAYQGDRFRMALWWAEPQPRHDGKTRRDIFAAGYGAQLLDEVCGMMEA